MVTSSKGLLQPRNTSPAPSYLTLFKLACPKLLNLSPKHPSKKLPLKVTFNIKKQKPFNSILQHLPRLRGSRKSEDASGFLGDKIVCNTCSKRNAITWGSPRSILPLRRFTSPTGGPTPWTMALMYMKGFASFTEKGNDEQKLLLRVLGTGMSLPLRQEEKSKGPEAVGDVEPRCVYNGVFWKVPVCVSLLLGPSYECVSAYCQNYVFSLHTKNS